MKDMLEESYDLPKRSLAENVFRVAAVVSALSFMLYTCSVDSKRAARELYERGFNDGAGKALDTVIVIVERQLKKGSGVTEMTIVTSEQDTVSYFLSNKTLRP